MTRMTNYTALALLAAVTACATPAKGGITMNGHKVDGDKAFQNLDQKVADKYRAQPWFRHIKKSLSDDSDKYFAITTDLNFDSPDGKRQSVAICNAYAKTSVGDVRVSVYARRTTTKTTTKVDGSKSTTSKTADDLRARSKAHVSFSGPDYLKECDVFESLFGD